jgi:hypothetical protein
LNWSPEQIAGWLKRAHPEDEYYYVSHETIFRQAFNGLLVLDAVGFDERIERSLGGLPGLRNPDVIE